MRYVMVRGSRWYVTECPDRGAEGHSERCVQLSRDDSDGACSSLAAGTVRGSAAGHAYSHGGADFRLACDRALEIEREQDATGPRTGPKVRIRLYWDEQDGAEPGWYAEVQTCAEDGRWDVSDDSLKVGFPVDLDQYSRNDRSGVVSALRKAYPAAEIVEGV